MRSGGRLPAPAGVHKFDLILELVRSRSGGPAMLMQVQYITHAIEDTRRLNPCLPLRPALAEQYASGFWKRIVCGAREEHRFPWFLGTCAFSKQGADSLTRACP